MFLEVEERRVSHATFMVQGANAALCPALAGRTRRPETSARISLRWHGRSMNVSFQSTPNPLRVRAVFISDVHLGTRGCRSEFLIDFLRTISCEQMFLVGDIIDGWRLRKSWYWDADCDEVLRLILRHARAGTEITYIPGNHDEMFRPWLAIGLEIGGIRMRREALYETLDGRRLLVIHGDEFDSVVRYARFLALLGDWAYTAALAFNTRFNAVRRRMGYPYWSLSAWLKRQVKEAVKAIDRFEAALASEARRRGLDGVICGHIHYAEMRDVGGVLYINDGDWVESCTALVEHHDGRLELLDWAAIARLSFAAPRRRASRVPASA
jgi:UDP-2,3-diacylglucosamine pyrophosphatase LpxH